MWCKPIRGHVLILHWQFYCHQAGLWSNLGDVGKCWPCGCGFPIVLDVGHCIIFPLVYLSAIEQTSSPRTWLTSMKFHTPYWVPEPPQDIRADSRFVPCQWETALLCNDVSHWLGASLESTLRHSGICGWSWNLPKQDIMEWCQMNVMGSQPTQQQQLIVLSTAGSSHDDVIKWKHFPRYWPFVRGIHWSAVNSLHKGQWTRALMFSLICAWINSWVNNGGVGDLRCHRTHYDVTVILTTKKISNLCISVPLWWEATSY